MSILTVTHVFLLAAHLTVGLVSLCALAWFTDALDRAAASRRFDAIVAALVLAGPLTLAWLLTILAAAQVRAIVRMRGTR